MSRAARKPAVPPAAKPADAVDIEALKDQGGGQVERGKIPRGAARFEDRTGRRVVDSPFPTGTYERTRFIVTARVTEEGKWRVVDGKTLELTERDGKKERTAAPSCGFAVSDRFLTIRYQRLE